MCVSRFACRRNGACLIWLLFGYSSFWVQRGRCTSYSYRYLPEMLFTRRYGALAVPNNGVCPTTQ